MVKFKTFDDTCLKPQNPYISHDNLGREVTVQKKNPLKHGPGHSLEDTGYIFHNLGYILSDKKTTINPPSNTIKTKEHQKIGQVLVYRRKDFVKDLNPPGYPDWKGDETEVIVLYLRDKKAKPRNFTLTYHIRPEV